MDLGSLGSVLGLWALPCPFGSSLEPRQEKPQHRALCSAATAWPCQGLWHWSWQDGHQVPRPSVLFSSPPGIQHGPYIPLGF